MCTCSWQAGFSLLSCSDMPSSKTKTPDSAAAVQSRGMQVVAVPGLKHPNGKSMDILRQQQESSSPNADMPELDTFQNLGNIV